MQHRCKRRASWIAVSWLQKVVVGCTGEFRGDEDPNSCSRGGYSVERLVFVPVGCQGKVKVKARGKALTLSPFWTESLRRILEVRDTNDYMFEA